MRRQAVKELDKDQPSLVYLTDVSSTGINYTYTIQLFESLWQFTFQDGQRAYSHPACQVLSREGSDGSQQDFDQNTGSCDDLQDAYRKIRYALGVAPAPGERVISIPEKPLHTIVVITAAEMLD